MSIGFDMPLYTVPAKNINKGLDGAGMPQEQESEVSHYTEQQAQVQGQQQQMQGQYTWQQLRFYKVKTGIEDPSLLNRCDCVNLGNGRCAVLVDLYGLCKRIKINLENYNKQHYEYEQYYDNALFYVKQLFNIIKQVYEIKDWNIDKFNDQVTDIKTMLSFEQFKEKNIKVCNFNETVDYIKNNGDDCSKIMDKLLQSEQSTDNGPDNDDCKYKNAKIYEVDCGSNKNNKIIKKSIL